MVDFRPDEIRLKSIKIRDDHQGKMAAILTDAQKALWKEMLGKPFDLGARASLVHLAAQLAS